MRTLALLLTFLATLTSALAQTNVAQTTYVSGQTAAVSGPETITTAPAVLVSNGASVSFFANTRITLSPGFTAQSGGYFHAANTSAVSTYALSVQNGSGAITGVPSGTTQAIHAVVPPGFTFSGWSILSGPGSIASSSSADTTFSFGSGSTIIRANLTTSVVDSDGDGIPDDWETAHGLDPHNASDASADPDGDGLTNLQEYKLSHDPHVADNFPPPAKVFPVAITLVGQGSGSATISSGGQSATLSFSGSGWTEPVPLSGDTVLLLNLSLGTEVSVSVSSSGLSNFVVKATVPSYISPQSRVRVQCGGNYVNSISQSELVSGAFKLKVVPTGSIPFGRIDTSRFEAARFFELGLGAGASGETAGRIVCGVADYALNASSGFVVVEGPALIQKWASDPTRYQAQVPTGYVDIDYEHGVTVVRFYPNGSYGTSGGYNDFSGTVPIVTYTLTKPTTSGGPATVTRTAGTVAEVLEYQVSTSLSEGVDGPHAYGDPAIGQTMTIYNDTYTMTTDSWNWRNLGTTRGGLTETVSTTAITKHIVRNSGGAFLSESDDKNAVYVALTRYAGATNTTSVSSYEHRIYDIGDYWYQQLTLTESGVGSDYVLGPGRSTNPAYYSDNGHPLKIGPLQTSNGLGGGTFTEYFSRPWSSGDPSNLGSQPAIALGEVRCYRESFLDNAINPVYPITSSTDIVTMFSYGTGLVDGSAAPSSKTTTYGSTTLNSSTFSYGSGTLNGLSTYSSTETMSTGTSPSVTKTVQNFSRRAADNDIRGKPAAVTNADGSKVSYRYQRGTLSGSTWTASSTGASLLYAELNGKTGSGVSSYAGGSVDPLDMDPYKSTVTEKITGSDGEVLREASYVYTGSAFSLLTAMYSYYDAYGNLLMKADQPISLDSNGVPSTSGRVFYQASFDGWRKTSETDEEGVTTTYSYDSYGQVKYAVRSEAQDTYSYVYAATTTFNYDVQGRVTSQVVSSAGASDTLTTSYTYDTANRVLSTTAPGGLVTSVAYSLSNPKTKTTTLPTGGTRTETVYADGRPATVSGSGVPDVTTTYSFITGGDRSKVETTGTGQVTTTVSDWAGRTKTVTSATYSGGTRVVTSSYNNLGQLTSQVASSGSEQNLAHLYEYDTYGRLSREANSTTTGHTIVPGTDYDVVQHDKLFQTGAPGYSSNWYLYAGELIWPYDGSNVAVSRYSSQSYQQVSGLTDAISTHSIMLDFDRNKTESITSIDRAGRSRIVATSTTGTSVTTSQVYLDGMLVATTNAQGQLTAESYDGLGRATISTDPRIGSTTTTYVTNTPFAQSVMTPDGITMSYTYDSAGHVASTTDANGKHAYFQYDAAGNLTSQWGDTVNPVAYEYNDLGQKTAMHTYQSGTFPGTFSSSAGSVTTWSYQSTTGLLLHKYDAVNHDTAYQYNWRGQVSQRTDARGIVTTYGYNNSGNPRHLLDTVTYSDGTPSVTRSYDHAGRPATVIDAAGTHTFAYYDTSTDPTYDNDLLNKSARLKSEALSSGLFNGWVLQQNYQYSVSGRQNGALSGFTALSSGTNYYEEDYAYDAVLRPSSITYNGGTPFVYTYVANSNLIDTVSQGLGYLRDYNYQVTSNRIDTLKHSWGTVASSQTETRLTYDSLGRRSMEKTQGTGYLTALGRSSDPGVNADYSYTDRSELNSSGKYLLGSDWSVGSFKTGTDRDYTYDAIGNRTGDVVAGVSGSYSPNSQNEYTVAPGAASMTYDNCGNLITDGTSTYTYDAENRLIQVVQGSSTWHYSYDYLNRRIAKWGTGISETRFLYDGWNVVAELNSSAAVVRRFAWGLDVSRTLDGAGGVGGLLAIDTGSATYLAIYDASHNVIGLYDGSGGFAAAYEYDPFGRIQTSAGSYAPSNPYRYSTKYTDSETTLTYYGQRFYSPQWGRFINRDPIEEAGGINLYGFCCNDAVNRWDILGSNDDQTAFERLFRTGDPTAGSNGHEGDTMPGGNGVDTWESTYHSDGPGGAGYYNDQEGGWQSWKEIQEREQDNLLLPVSVKGYDPFGILGQIQAIDAWSQAQHSAPAGPQPLPSGKVSAELVGAAATFVRGLNGSWVNKLLEIYPKTLVVSFLKRAIIQYQQISVAHITAMKTLPTTASYKDMALEVNKVLVNIAPSGLYQFKPDGSITGVGGTSMTAGNNIITIAPLTWDSNVDSPFVVMSRYFSNISVYDHEYTHFSDRENAINSGNPGAISTAQFKAQSEANAYQAQVNLLTQALNYIK